MGRKDRIKKRFMDQLYFWQKIIWIGPGIMAFIGICIGYYANTKVHKLKAEIEDLETRKGAKAGIVTPVKSDSSSVSKDITILIGANKIELNETSLMGGDSIPPLKFAIDTDFPLFVKLNKERDLLVSCKFRDLNNKIVAEMINNEWEINPNNFFKRNYDDHGVEIIDQEGITKLQIDFIDKRILKIGGVFRDSYVIYFISDKTIESTDIRLINRDEIIKKGETIPNMFMYPADKNLGKRANISDKS